MAEVPSKTVNTDGDATTAGNSRAMPCDPCLTLDKKSVASNYCVQCKECFCEECMIYHNAFTVSRDHTVKAINDIDLSLFEASGITKTPRSISVKDCEFHPGKRIERFCIVHSALSCGECTSESHGACKSENLETVSKGYAGTEGYDKEIRRLAILKTRIIDVRNRTLTQVSDEIREMSTNSRQTAKTVAKKILFSYIDDSADALKTKLDEKIAKTNGALANMLVEVQRIQVAMDSKTDLEDELFTLVTRQDTKLKRFESYLDECFEKLPTFWFINVNRDHPSFVSIKPSTKKQLATQNDKDVDCTITDIVCLFDGRVILADLPNKSLKLLGRDDKFQAAQSLESKPLNVVEIEPGRVAVTLPEAKVVQTFAVTDEFNKELTIDMEDAPTGLASVDQRLYVSFKSHILLLDARGKIIERISKDEEGNKLFKDIGCILIDSTIRVFYMVDDGLLHGTPLESLRKRPSIEGVDLLMRSEEGFKPSMTVDGDHSLYVCTPSDVVKLTPDLGVIQRFPRDKIKSNVSTVPPSAVEKGPPDSAKSADSSSRGGGNSLGAKNRTVKSDKMRQKPLFGTSTTSTGGLFGGPTSTSTISGSGLFGASTTSTSGLFGSQTGTPNTLVSTTSQLTPHQMASPTYFRPSSACVYTKYCVGYNKALERLYIGGESNMITVLQIG